MAADANVPEILRILDLEPVLRATREVGALNRLHHEPPFTVELAGMFENNRAIRVVDRAMRPAADTGSNRRSVVNS